MIRGLTLLPNGVYDVDVLDVHDGDTITVSIPVVVKVRVDGIQSPELHGPDAGKAAAARDYLVGLLASKKAVVTITGNYKYASGERDNPEKMADVLTTDGQDVGPTMIAAGLAVKWDGHGPRPAG